MQDGETPLIHAAEKGNEDCVRLLLDAGADKEVKNTVCRVLLAEGVEVHIELSFINMFVSLLSEVVRQHLS